ncbi:hypothetical protein AVEN_135061-1 [Araneus ventricosus]|uniref:Uncharacterized protein n=1 Tax=Araneus ventricosus TaxID=182803 RepID=A0A4Y2CY73_ARAVE|nr:hypothetical protein AVEN_135061-1 [Araneus ventricosus]
MKRIIIYTQGFISIIRFNAVIVLSKRNSLQKSLLSLVIFTSRFEATRGLFWDGPHILNRGQMTRTTNELAPPSPSFKLPHNTSGRAFSPDVHQTRLYDDSAVESVLNLEPSTPPGRDLTTRPQLPLKIAGCGRTLW